MLISLDLGGGGANCARAVFATGLTLSLSGYQPPSPPGGGTPIPYDTRRLVQGCKLRIFVLTWRIHDRTPMPV